MHENFMHASYTVLMKTLRLNDSAHIPVIGLGTSQLRGETCTQTILDALDIGYRHLDTAEAYGNHEAIGEAIKRMTIPRAELFLTTKIPPSFLDHDSVIAHTGQYLEELNVEYIDLLLIHWPNSATPIAETLSAMDKLRSNGKIRAIGVSNFTPHHLDDALATSIPVTINQVELHPTFNQKELRAYGESKNIVLTAYAPLGRGADMQNPLLLELADKYHVSLPQVVLNWIIGRGIVAIPKATGHAHLEDNFHALDWQLDPADVARIESLPQGERLFNPSSGEFDY